jgi:hypothetical protein
MRHRRLTLMRPFGNGNGMICWNKSAPGRGEWPVCITLLLVEAMHGKDEGGMSEMLGVR